MIDESLLNLQSQQEKYASVRNTVILALRYAQVKIKSPLNL